MRLELTAPQFDFVAAPEKFPAFVGGFGSGKTHAAVVRALRLKLDFPGGNVGYYLPTFDLVKKIGFPRFGEMLEAMRIPSTLNKTDAVIEIGPGGRWGQIIFRTMDTPERIVGYEVADSLVDELDTLPRDKAADVWMKVLGRNRQKKPGGVANSVGVATTPEGFRFVFERWKKAPVEGYRLIKASTHSNAANLPADYIADLTGTYPANLLAAYLDGEFVNLQAGSVYPDFDREQNASRETIREHEPLHIGMDFNVQRMAAVIYVLRDGAPHAVKEYTGVLDTPAMVALLKSRHPGHTIYVYPDSSGGSRRSNDATVSDIALLRQAGFTVLAHATNPAVKDRVLAVNAKLRDRSLRVNVDHCPGLVEALEQQAYDKNGEPDKSAGLDHVIDAAGYCIAYRWPILKRSFATQELRY